MPCVIALHRRFWGVKDLDWAQSVEQGHGRREIRTLHTLPIVQADWDWPGLKQVCRLVSQVYRKGSWEVEVHYKITSLSTTQAKAKDLLVLSRSHWGIENRLHYVRDVTLGEGPKRPKLQFDAI